MRKFADGLLMILKVLTITLAVALVVVVMLQILGRHILTQPMPWTEELSRLILVMIVTTSAPLTANSNKYVRVDVAINLIPERIRKIVVAALDVVVAIFLFFVAYQAIGLARTGAMQMTPVMEIPMSFAYGCMVVCPALSGFFFLINAIPTLKAAVSHQRSREGEL